MKKRSQARVQKKRKQALMLIVMGAIALGAIAAAAILPNIMQESQAFTVDVVAAQLSEEGQAGAALFKMNCQVCHGPNAAGTKLGPPLIHDIYNPGHHSDQAFYLAAATGVRQHHWPYGDMPAQPQVAREDVSKIIRYIREMQEANGIAYKAHGM
ncbi:MAG: cytochrome c [Chloroflexota bacterium]|nr:cytochrome c [Chloroflexota bacterium]MDE2952097.1 cytochrome c [Chloroflexota bacterium]